MKHLAASPTLARLMQLRVWIAVIALPVACACSARRPAALALPHAGRPFVITFWCGPPLSEFTDERAAEIAAAGFNVVGAPCEGKVNAEANQSALEIAQRHGLRMWIADPGIGGYTTLARDWGARLDAVVAGYRNYPALDGYAVTDEPEEADFDAIAPVVDRLRSADPGRIAYVNLLPLGASPAYRAGAYEKYVEGFIERVQPQLLSYDCYPFLEHEDRAGFFDNLATIRSIALRHHLPFMLIVQAMPHAHYRDPTESELGWQIFHALAFGARGISYFAYWTPVKVASADEMHFHYGLIENGKPTRHYFEAMRLNQKATALAAQLASFESLGVADSAGEIGGPFPIGPIVAIEGGQITAGMFIDTTGRIAALLVNRDYRYGATVRLHLRDDAAMPEHFDVVTGQWAPLTDTTVTFAPGDAQLLRWSGAAAWP